VNDDRSNDVRRAAGIVDADRAARAEHAPFHGKKRRHLLEDIPRADLFLGCRQHVEVVRKAEGEAADQTTVRTKELDRRGDWIHCKAGDPPHLECAIRQRFRPGRTGRDGDEIGQTGERIDLLKALLHQRLDRPSLIERLRAVARLHEFCLRAIAQREHICVERKSGQDQPD
jgi:hypothetical protein